MITGKILKSRGWPEGRIIGQAKRAAGILQKQGMTRSMVLDRLDRVRDNPDAFTADPVFGALAAELIRISRQETLDDQPTELRASPVPYRIWGEQHIDPGALSQMDAAMRLPVTVAGALMPDAHIGYGLPIGGVLATEGSVIPYAVGVDIACRMRMSLYPLPPNALDQQPDRFRRSLLDKTYFGAGVKNPDRPDHAVLDEDTWSQTKLLHSLRDTAVRQIGTSGTGNHFVEWGVLTLTEADPHLELEAGEYLALLSHSGSRAVGFKIANAYSTLAMDLHAGLDKSVRHLAWLPLDSGAGQEYWLSMELAGRFASANHRIIHHAVARAVGLTEAAAVENHHNFAWRETVRDEDGTEREVIVHRKGATPAGPGVLGIIPGSMADTGYLVRGRGDAAALNSAAHGAGRAMSRKAAMQTVARADRDAYLQQRGVTLIGGGLDEAPQAYKRIQDVIAAQSDLVDVIGTFRPRIVRMANEPGDI